MEYQDTNRKAQAMAERKCVICGKAFASSHPGKLTCSYDCSVERNREMTNIWHEKNKGKSKIPKTIKCAVCGKEVRLKMYATQQKYCSNKCSQRAFRKRKQEAKAKTRDPKVVKANRAQTQINIDRESAEAKKLGLTYGKLKQQQFLATTGSVLDQEWAQELMKRNEAKQCQT